jgi:hypothetical protein
MKTDEKCEAVINQLITKGFLCQVNEHNLKAAIMRSLRVLDNRTIKNVINALIALEYLDETAPKVYKLNLEAIQEKATLEALKSKQITLTEAQAGVDYGNITV